MGIIIKDEDSNSVSSNEENVILPKQISNNSIIPDYVQLAKMLPMLKRAHTLEQVITKPKDDQIQKNQVAATPRVIAAPVDELTSMVQIFDEQHQKAMKIPKAILILRHLPDFRQLTLLQIEHAQIRKIFYLLKPCQ